jgi:MoaA/NifB/PqqE/SkfB family radical SAM enzyme
LALTEPSPSSGPDVGTRLWGRLVELPGVGSRLEESYALLKLRRRLRPRRPAGRLQPPERPVGIKLELTHACNLRCDFCYTDSPRHTLARTQDLTDETWRATVDQAIELGVVEAVVTGGEPLLRAPLALELTERLAGAGVGVTLNTNGWFVDAAIADRLAAIRGLTVHISLDGATPSLHDAARGVPGSWRRAVQALSLLLERGVPVVVVHVATPLNVQWVEPLLENLWLLGVRAVRLTPVVPVGAASRDEGWSVDRRELRRLASEAACRFGDSFQPVVQAGIADIVATRAHRAPAALLVRPSGAVLIDSLHPFAFGHVQDGLAACWDRIVSQWQAPELQAWAAPIRNPRGLAHASVVPYADIEPVVGSEQVSRLPRRRKPTRDAPRLPRRAARSTEPAAAPDDLVSAREHVLELGLARRYRAAAYRWSGESHGDRVVRLVDSGRMCKLNATAGLVLDQIADRTVGDAVEALASCHRDVPREQLIIDTLRTADWLAARGILRHEPAPTSA